MACYYPIRAFRCFGGKIVFREVPGIDIVRQLELPCGKCVGCRLERSRQWSIRIMHEASLYDHNCFVTLTYDDAHLPADQGLRYSDFQDFMRKLRYELSPQKIRFYMCGEYGENYLRPHFHACLFNCSFPDRRLHGKGGSSSLIYTSALLSKCWPNGFASIGDLTLASAAYTARYVMKKQTNNPNLRSIDVTSGEIVQLTPEFNRMSLKPGIGAEWFARFGKTDVFPHDRVVVNGYESKPPRYYDLLHARDSPLEFEDIQFKRELDALSRSHDNTFERLAVKETVVKSRLSQLKRHL